jgi:hypothetical protein
VWILKEKREREKKNIDNKNPPRNNHHVSPLEEEGTIRNSMTLQNKVLLLMLPESSGMVDMCNIFYFFFILFIKLSYCSLNQIITTEKNLWNYKKFLENMLKNLYETTKKFLKTCFENFDSKNNWVIICA